MKAKTKALILALSAVLLVVTTVFVTMAFLTDTDKVTNTFTVGKVDIELDESIVDSYGEVVLSSFNSSMPTHGNEYKLIPGHFYVKNPTVHVKEDSEKSWLFVKVENNLKNIIADDSGSTTPKYLSIEKQILDNGWTALTGVDNVYYREANAYDVSGTNDYTVFDNFTIADNADISDYENKKIVITAYAIQYDGFANNLAGAWDAVKDKAN